MKPNIKRALKTLVHAIWIYMAVIWMLQAVLPKEPEHWWDAETGQVRAGYTHPYLNLETEGAKP